MLRLFRILLEIDPTVLLNEGRDVPYYMRLIEDFATTDKNAGTRRLALYRHDIQAIYTACVEASNEEEFDIAMTSMVVLLLSIDQEVIASLWGMPREVRVITHSYLLSQQQRNNEGDTSENQARGPQSQTLQEEAKALDVWIASYRKRKASLMGVDPPLSQDPITPSPKPPTKATRYEYVDTKNQNNIRLPFLHRFRRDTADYEMNY
jgi:hypothetical protein